MSPRQRSLFDVRDRPSTMLVDGIYGGMPLYNFPDGPLEARIPCKTGDNGVTVQVYERDEPVGPLTWNRYERPFEDVQPRHFTFARNDTEIVSMAILETEVTKGGRFLTRRGKHYLTELGCWLLRLRRTGVQCLVTIITDSLSSQWVNAKFLETFGNTRVVIAKPPETDEFRCKCFGLRTRVNDYLMPKTRLAIWMDLDLAFMRSCPDLERILVDEVIHEQSFCFTYDRLNTIAALRDPRHSYFHQAGQRQWDRVTALGIPDSAPHFNGSLMAWDPHLHRRIWDAWRDEWERGGKGLSEIPLICALKTTENLNENVTALDVRYNRYIWDLFYRYQVGLDKDDGSLWLDDVVGLQSHVATMEIAAGIGYREMVEDLAGIPHSSNTGGDFFQHGKKMGL